MNQVKIKGYTKRSHGPVADRGYYIHLGEMRWIRVRNEREAKAKLVELSKELDQKFRELMACYRTAYAEGLRHLYYLPDEDRVLVLHCVEQIHHQINYLIRAFAQGQARENAFCIGALKKITVAVIQMVGAFENAARIDHTGIHESFSMVRLQVDKIRSYLEFQEYHTEKKEKRGT